MIQPALHIFSQTEEKKSSIADFIYYVGRASDNIGHDFKPEKHSHTYSIIEDITTVLDGISPVSLLNTAVILDITESFGENNTWNPINSSLSVTDIAATLVLLYPEVYWIFIGTALSRVGISSKCLQDHLVDPSNNSGCGMTRCIELLKRHQTGYRPIFDPSGLRTYLKKSVLPQGKTDNQILASVLDTLSKRSNRCSVVIDEEIPYVFLNGYAAYRFGYRCNIITSREEMDRVLIGGDTIIKLSLEDLDIRLTNMKDDLSTSLRDPVIRGIKYPDLNYANRIYITGVAQGTEREILRDDIVDKPYAGIYHLRNYFLEKGVIDPSLILLGNVDYLSMRRQYSYVKKLSKLPSQNTPRTLDNRSNGHSTSNRLLNISYSLIRRARNILITANGCEESIHGAVLSSEAHELLHGCHITTALEAISLRHQFEVKAECSFCGVAHEIRTDERLAEIKGEGDAVLGLTSDSDTNKIAQSYNAQLEIVNNIRLIFGEFEQFDEEEKCINKVRQLRQGLHFFSTFNSDYNARDNSSGVSLFSRLLFRSDTKKKGSRYLAKYSRLLMSLFIERYFHWLVASIRNLIVSALTWIGFFSLAYILYLGLCHSADFLPSYHFQTVAHTALASLGHSALTFFEMQPADIMKSEFNDKYTTGLYFNGITFFEILISYVHLGIFISYLYQKLSRR